MTARGRPYYIAAMCDCVVLGSVVVQFSSKHCAERGHRHEGTRACLNHAGSGIRQGGRQTGAAGAGAAAPALSVGAVEEGVLGFLGRER